MTENFVLTRFDPCPLSQENVLDSGSDSKALIAMDVRSKYYFVDDKGEFFHEYEIPSNADIHNCGGYVDKIVKYRDPALKQYLTEQGVTDEAFHTDRFPILATRSPQCDLILYRLMMFVKEHSDKDKISLFDLGCTVSEHWDFLNLLIDVGSRGQEDAATLMTYYGLDKSQMLLGVSRLMHDWVEAEHFNLLRADGTDFDFADHFFDFSLTIGVVNHVARPKEALAKLIKATRYAVVAVIWVTLDEQGYESFTHSLLPYYCFTLKELQEIGSDNGEGKWYITDYVPESKGSQQKSLIGVGTDNTSELGSLHLLYTSLEGFAKQQKLVLLEDAVFS